MLWLGQFGTLLIDSNLLLNYFLHVSVLACFCFLACFWLWWLVIILERHRCYYHLSDTYTNLMFCYPSHPRRMRSVNFLWYAVGHALHIPPIIPTLLLTIHTITQNTYLCQPSLNICIVLWLIWLCWCFEKLLLL